MNYFISFLLQFPLYCVLINGLEALTGLSVWWWDEVNECYESLCGDMGGVHRIREVNKLNDYPHHYTHWLPHWAIKIPEVKEND